MQALSQLSYGPTQRGRILRAPTGSVNGLPAPPGVTGCPQAAAPAQALSRSA